MNELGQNNPVEPQVKKSGFIASIFKGIGRMVSKTTLFVIERVAGILIVLAIVYGLPYYFLEKNPEVKEKIINKLGNIDEFFSSGGGSGGGGLGGFDIQSMLSIFSGAKPAVQKETVIERTIVQQKLDYIPSELAPFVQALEKARETIEGTSEVERYKAMLTSDRIGSHGEKAIPMLEKALGSASKDIRRGAFASLKLVGTPEAKKVLTDYVRKAKSR